MPNKELTNQKNKSLFYSQIKNLVKINQKLPKNFEHYQYQSLKISKERKKKKLSLQLFQNKRNEIFQFFWSFHFLSNFHFIFLHKISFQLT